MAAFSADVNELRTKCLQPFNLPHLKVHLFSVTFGKSRFDVDDRQDSSRVSTRVRRVPESLRQKASASEDAEDLFSSHLSDEHPDENEAGDLDESVVREDRAEKPVKKREEKDFQRKCHPKCSPNLSSLRMLTSKRLRREEKGGENP